MANSGETVPSPLTPGCEGAGSSTSEDEPQNIEIAGSDVDLFNFMNEIKRMYDHDVPNTQSDSSVDSDTRNHVDNSNSNGAANTFAFRNKNHLGDKMVDQGFEEEGGENNEENERFIDNFEARKLEIDKIEFEGETFESNKCYRIEDRVFAIVHFLRGVGEQSECTSAYCTEIIRFQDTVLERAQDTSDLLHIAPQSINEFVQRAGYKQEIQLAIFEEEEEDVENIPDWMYIGRERGSGSSFLFGFVDTSKTPERNGYRHTDRTCIDFFAGAGLASSGFEASGFKIIASIEKNKDAVRSYAKIHKAKAMEISSTEWKNSLNKENGRVAFCGTAKDFLIKYKNSRAFQEALGSIDLVILCPPCQGFSKENRLKGGKTEQNNNESLRILDAARLIRPKVLVFENVTGLWETNHIKQYFQKIVYGLMNMGYNVQVGILYAADFGDPQKRPRLILIASLSEIGLPVFPRRTHGQPFMSGDVSGTLIPYVTVKDALRPEEGKHPEKETPVTLERDPKRDPKPNEPARAVMASKSALHYCENRNYSLIENAILMGQAGAKFVARLVGIDNEKQRQIGNGVPMKLSKAIARAVNDVLDFNWVGVDDIASASTSTISETEENNELDLTTASSQTEENGEANAKNTNGQTEENGEADEKNMNTHTEENGDAEVTITSSSTEENDDVKVKNEAVAVKSEINIKNEAVVVKNEVAVKSEMHVKTEAGVKVEAKDEKETGANELVNVTNATDMIDLTDMSEMI